MVVQNPGTENACGEHQAGRLSVRVLRLCAVVFVFVASGMALTSFLATSSLSFALLLLFLPLAGVALAPALKYAVTRSRELNQRLGVWHWVLLLQFLSALVFRVRGIEDIHEATVDAWALYRITLMGVVGLVLAARLVSGKTEWSSWLFRGLIGAMGVYAGICIVSTIWSVFPSWTLYKSCEYLVDVLCIATVVSSVRGADDFRSLWNWIWVLYGLLIVSIWAGALLAPTLAFLPNAGLFGFELQGVMPQVSTNGVGEAAALLGVVALARLVLRRHLAGSASWYWLLLLLSLATLVLAQTRSAVVAFLFGALLIGLHRNARLAILVLVACGFVALVSSAVAHIAQIYMLRGQSTELFHSLSGRMDWWQSAWVKIMERPLLGYGAYAGGRFVVLAQFGDMETSSIHNSYVEVVLGSGILGVLPLLAALAGAWRELWSVRLKSLVSNADRQLAVEALAVLGVITARSLFSVTMIWHPALEFFLVLGYAELLRRRRVDARQLGRELGPAAKRFSSRPLWSSAQ
jgi:O-antigen ligase